MSGALGSKITSLVGRGWRFGKRLYQPLRYPQAYPETLLFIMGCQRSGTGLLGRILRNDPDSVVFGEFTELNSLDTETRIRLDPPERVRSYLMKMRAPLVVVKPLVESQNARALFSELENLKVVWLYRDYRDVVASNLKKFGHGNGLDDIRPLMNGETGNWRAENVPQQLKAVVEKHYSEDMSQADAAALFWYVRNSLYFEQALDKEDRVLLIAYHDLVQDTKRVIKRIYDFIARKFPGDYLYREVHKTSIGKGSSVRFSPEIEKLCAELLDRLEAVKRQGA